MRPLTDKRPKPLVTLAGRALIDHGLDRLATVDVHSVIVNTHHLGGQLANHLAHRPEVVLSQESELLETGGGVKHALGYFGSDAFLVLNCDAVWLDATVPALARLMGGWRDTEMDALLLLYPAGEVATYSGEGDYDIDSDGRAQRRHSGRTAPYLFAGLQVLHPRLFAGSPDEPFSLNLLYDAAERSGRLYAMIHDGRWFHVGTPDELRYAEQELLASPATAGSP
jgi:MurNAc alpha-1-phosphate uridylyltransferase